MSQPVPSIDSLLADWREIQDARGLTVLEGDTVDALLAVRPLLETLESLCKSKLIALPESRATLDALLKADAGGGAG